MQVRQAKRTARDWVMEEASRLPGFGGAYFAGSTNGLVDDALAPPTSDLDVNLVFTSGPGPIRRSQQVRAFLPRLWEVAEAVMAASPQVTD